MILSFAYDVMMLRNEFVEFCNQKLQDIGLSQGQLFFIIYIGKHKACSPKALAKDLHMDSGHATRMISKLVEQGFVQQRVKETDKRSHVLTLTTQGEDAFSLSYDVFHQWDEEVMKNLSPEEKTAMMELVRHLARRKEETTCVR